MHTRTITLVIIGKQTLQTSTCKVPVTSTCFASFTSINLSNILCSCNYLSTCVFVLCLDWHWLSFVVFINITPLHNKLIIVSQTKCKPSDFVSYLQYFLVELLVKYCYLSYFCRPAVT